MTWTNTSPNTVHAHRFARGHAPDEERDDAEDEGDDAG